MRSSQHVRNTRLHRMVVCIEWPSCIPISLHALLHARVATHCSYSGYYCARPWSLVPASSSFNYLTSAEFFSPLFFDDSVAFVRECGFHCAERPFKTMTLQSRNTYICMHARKKIVYLLHRMAQLILIITFSTILYNSNKNYTEVIRWKWFFKRN